MQFVAGIKMKKVIQNQSGMSLIEVLLIAGMTVLMGMTFASIIGNQQSASRNLQQVLEANQITDAVRAFLGQQANCDKSLVGKSTIAVSTPIDELRDGNNTIVFTKDPTSPIGEQVKISQMELVGPSVFVPEYALDKMQLNVYYAKVTDSAGGVMRPRQLDILIEKAGNSIAACAAKSPNTPLCQEVSNNTSSNSITVNCSPTLGPEYKIFSCGWRDTDPDKNGNREFFPLPATQSYSGGCFCRDDDSGSPLYCYALCCKW
jgi:hypothetical protein